MKINGNQIRPGMLLSHNGSLWRVAKVQAVQPGKGGAYAQVEMRNIESGTKVNERFRASESVERISLQQRQFSFIYRADSKYVFMDLETYEQVEVEESVIGDTAAFLKDGMRVELEYHQDKLLNVSLPAQVELRIVETEPNIMGRTATSSYKPAIAENGVRVMVPEFINEGDHILVDIADVSYVKRV